MKIFVNNIYSFPSSQSSRDICDLKNDYAKPYNDGSSNIGQQSLRGVSGYTRWHPRILKNCLIYGSIHAQFWQVNKSIKFNTHAFRNIL
jgi:hypothetical protein